MFFRKQKENNFLYPFPFFSFSPSSLFLRSTAAPSILGSVAAQHPQLAAQPYPLNHRVKSAGAPQTILAFALPPWPSQFQPSAGLICAPSPSVTDVWPPLIIFIFLTVAKPDSSLSPGRARPGAAPTLPS
jgi:hypothetical protein